MSPKRDKRVSRRAPRRLALATLIALGTTLGSLPLAGGVASGADDEDSSPPPYLDDPQFRAMIEEAVVRQEHEAEQRKTPEAEQNREESATAYQSQSESEALDTAREEHPEVIGEPAWDPFTVAPASEVERYYGDYEARVDIPGESADGFVQSTLPLQAETESGGEAPVDLSLDEEGDALEPNTPLVETTIPEQLEEGVSLDDAAISFAAEGAEAAAPAKLEKDTAFYANAQTDSDVMVQPVPMGAHALWQLRSADSPENVALNFELPLGANLEPGGDFGGAHVVGDGEELAEVSQPVAWDAEGWPVELSFRVERGRMVIEVPHRSQDVVYPILIDPVVTESQPSFGTDYAGWRQVGFSPGGEVHSWYSDGFLRTEGRPGAYEAWEHGGWAFDAPGPEAYIYAVEFANVVAAQHKSLVSQGVYAPTRGAWDTGTTNFPNPSFPLFNASSPINTPSNIWTGSIRHCIGEDNIYCIGGTPGNQVLETIWSTEAGSHSQAFSLHTGGATIWIHDVTHPSHHLVAHTTNGQPGLPSGWVDDERLSVVTEAKDRGLGVKRFELSVPGSSPRIRVHDCAGHRLDRCPNDDAYHRSDEARVSGGSFSYRATPMPEGVNTVTARAADFADNWSGTRSWQVKVDHTPPDLLLDGNLWERADTQLGSANYRLLADATDGDSENPRSGVKSIEVKVDGERDHYIEQPCAADSCPLSIEYRFEAPAQDPGWHTIEVIATDHVGRVTSKSFQVEVPELLHTETLIENGGPRGLVRSPNAKFAFYSSKANSTFRCRLDQGAWGSCTSPKEYLGLADGDHTFEVQATDPSGDQDPSPARRTWTVDTVPPETTIGGGPNGPTNDRTPTFAFSSSDPGSTFLCRVDGNPFVECEGPPYGEYATYTTEQLSDGPHTFAVRARDPAGNVDGSQATRSFTVDTVPPHTTIEVGPTGPTNDSTPLFGFFSNEPGATFECRGAGEWVWISCGWPPFAHLATFTTRHLGDGSHTFEVRATDPAGNTDGSPATRGFTVDTVPPETTITSTPEADPEPTASFSFSSNEGGGGFQCELDGGGWHWCNSPQHYSGLAGAAHSLQVRAWDAAGNVDPGPATFDWQLLHGSIPEYSP